MSIEQWPYERVKEFRKGMDRLRTKFQRRQKRRNSLFGKALNRWISSLAMLIAVTAISGCASWHEPVSDFADQWGDKIGLDVEPPIPTDEIPVDEPVIVPAPEPQVDAPVALDHDTPSPYNTKTYPMQITLIDEYTLQTEGWTSLLGLATWDGSRWQTCNTRTSVDGDKHTFKLPIKHCGAVVFWDTSTRSISAKWHTLTGDL